jgi:hypothetical protein
MSAGVGSRGVSPRSHRATELWLYRRSPYPLALPSFTTRAARLLLDMSASSISALRRSLGCLGRRVIGMPFRPVARSFTCATLRVLGNPRIARPPPLTHQPHARAFCNCGGAGLAICMTTGRKQSDDVAEQLRDAAADAQQIAELNQHLRALAAVLTDHGFTVRVNANVLAVANPAASEGCDPRGRHLSPGLSQRVLLQHTAQGPWWFWGWEPLRAVEPMSAPPAPEIEPLGPADDIDDAARKICKVLRLAEPEGADR